jgi:uncharacterized protein
MRISFDPAKRLRTLADRGLDFEDAAIVFDGTLRGATRHVFSMRKANDREKARLAPYFEV